MERFDWNPVKSERLKRIRGINFEEILDARLISIKNHPSPDCLEIMLFECESFLWTVPFIRHKEGLFLKTLFKNQSAKKLSGGLYV